MTASNLIIAIEVFDNPYFVLYLMDMTQPSKFYDMKYASKHYMVTLAV